mmetsp:Transcript_4720/g.13167  ORF Transcript_4720/g.13167 Transcript_4720/m.13167 type:complete len:247 (+) Transcript_4720:411-1151(+)
MTTSNLEAQFNVERPGGNILSQSNVLHAWKDTRSGEVASAQPPVPSAGTAMLFVRLWWPPPHATLHMPQLDHGPRTQSASHACTLQTCSSSVSSHASPPYFISTRTSRDRSLTPPPHSDEQALHPLQSPSWQSTGQGCSLHGSSSSNGGQGMPPSAAMSTSRLRLRTPPPHVAEHSSSLQSLTSQSTRNIFTPSTFINSPRIFTRAHISDRSSFCASQHFVSVSVYSPFKSACCLPFACDCASASI